jgi:hypothetical protein
MSSFDFVSKSACDRVCVLVLGAVTRLPDKRDEENRREVRRIIRREVRRDNRRD